MRLSLAERLPAPLRPWYQAARPRSLPATYAPLLIGGAVTLAHDVFDPLRFLASLLAALLLQIASNFINEYVDYARGTDVHKVAGMGMVLKQGGLTPRQVLFGAVATLGGGIALGLLLVVAAGPALLLIGALGVLVVVAYTAGPLPLSHLGLGEAAVFFAMGPLMTLGTYVAVSGLTHVDAFLAGVPIAFTVAAILHANNMRDVDADRLVNKRTLAVRLGPRGAQVEFVVLVYGGYVAGLALVLAGSMPWTTLVAAL
ncbi:MAG: 1,4-dihydroxy-2-naphthoate octaprenyltransferase, partial [Anaerolineae bacterium]|nr:1,4-dihydroxy-2-naphthoate octaprenyltransferase [Anaerolineae bacterium]